MLVTFKSKSASDVIMAWDQAKRILDVLGKNPNSGFISAEEVSDALQKLEEEIHQTKVHATSEQMVHDVTTHAADNAHDNIQSVSFSARAFPFVEMLRAAKKDHQSVTWGINSLGKFTWEN